ncbi:MAG: hypothetical protein A2Z72_02735 [Omnitrophica bacterium RBG_13_46_9]|nr:MAG: hypothetical protein A2Z72_02735 [Omnitrophica bacterium RBG_13_46_9]
MKKILIAANRTEKTKRYVANAPGCDISVRRALLKKGFSVDMLYLEKRDFGAPLYKLKKKILDANPSCIFNLFDGFRSDSSKEAEFAEILEMTGIPFTGNSPWTLAACLDKETTKRILEKRGIATPRGVFIKSLADLRMDGLNFPLFIKPCFEDASIGINPDVFLAKENDIHGIVPRKLKEFPKGLIIEEFIPGKEYHAGFLRNFPYEMLGISVNNYSKHKDFLPFLTYSSKWKSDSEEFRKLIPSLDENIPAHLKYKIAEISSKAGEALGCRGYYRVDLRERDGQIFVLDMNPNPDISIYSGFMRQAYRIGYAYDDVIARIVALAGVSAKEEEEGVCALRTKKHA